jgi:hypothetical protein
MMARGEIGLALTRHLPPQPVLWPAYGENNFSFSAVAPTLFLATDINHRPAGDQPYLKLYFLSGTNCGDGPPAPRLAWPESWAVFSPALHQATGGVASLAASQLTVVAVVPSGAPASYLLGGFQIFASDANGDLWTIAQEFNANSNHGYWPPSWSQFSLPGGNKIAHLYPGNLDFSLPSLQRNALALAQTATGELQLFAIDYKSHVWTTWKLGVYTTSSWSNWERF